MFGMTLGNLMFRLGGDASGLEAAGRAGVESLDAVNARAVALGTTIGQLAADFIRAGARMVQSITTDSMRTIDQQAKLARSVGGTTAALQALERAGDRAGVQKTELASAATRLNQRLGQMIATGKGAEDTFRALGTTAAELSGMDIDERFAFLAERMREAGMTTQEMSYHLRELGIRQTSVITLIQGGAEEIRKSREIVERFGVAVSEIDAAKVEMANDAWAEMGRIMEGVGNIIAVEIAPLVVAFSNAMIDAAEDGDTMRDRIVSAIEGIVSAFGWILDAVRKVQQAWLGLQALALSIAEKIASAWSRVANAVASAAGTIANAWNNTIGAIGGERIDTSGIDQWRAEVEQNSFDAKEQLADTVRAIRALGDEPMPSQVIQDALQRVRTEMEEAATQAVETRRSFQDLFDPESSGGGGRGGGRGGRGRGGDAADREQTELEKQLERLREALMTAEEAERASYEQRLELLREFRERGMITQEEFDELTLRAHQEHTDKMREITQRAMEEELRAREQMLGYITGTLSAISSAMDREGDKQIGIQKAISLAIALINVYEGITKALTLPFPANLAAAAQTAAQGFAAIARIRSASRGGGGGSTVSGGGGSVSGAGAIGTAGGTGGDTGVPAAGVDAIGGRQARPGEGGPGAIEVHVTTEVKNGNLVPTMVEVAGEVTGRQLRQADRQFRNRAVEADDRGV